MGLLCRVERTSPNRLTTREALQDPKRWTGRASLVDRRWSWWGRAIFHVADVDALYRHAITEGLKPDTKPRDAEWGERYFHITDPDGHELSFARPLGTGPKHQP